jgi:hypothetical protein
VVSDICSINPTDMRSSVIDPDFWQHRFLFSNHPNRSKGEE